MEVTRDDWLPFIASILPAIRRAFAISIDVVTNHSFQPTLIADLNTQYNEMFAQASKHHLTEFSLSIVERKFDGYTITSWTIPCIPSPLLGTFEGWNSSAYHTAPNLQEWMAKAVPYLDLQHANDLHLRYGSMEEKYISPATEVSLETINMVSIRNALRKINTENEPLIFLPDLSDEDARVVALFAPEGFMFARWNVIVASKYQELLSIRNYLQIQAGIHTIVNLLALDGNCPIIVHNGAQQLISLYTHTIGKIPDLKTFTKNLHQFYSRVIDTSYNMLAYGFASTDLSSCYEYMRSKIPCPVHSNNRTYHPEREKWHRSYMTIVVYLGLVHNAHVIENRLRLDLCKQLWDLTGKMERTGISMYLVSGKEQEICDKLQDLPKPHIIHTNKKLCLSWYVHIPDLETKLRELGGETV